MWRHSKQQSYFTPDKYLNILTWNAFLYVITYRSCKLLKMVQFLPHHVLWFTKTRVSIFDCDYDWWFGVTVKAVVFQAYYHLTVPDPVKQKWPHVTALYSQAAYLHCRL